MDPLSALSIAAVVVQFVEFGGKLLKKAWESYHDDSIDLQGNIEAEEREVRRTIGELVRLINDLEATTRTTTLSIPSPTPALSVGPSIRTPAQLQLQQYCVQCKATIAGFVSTLDRLKTQSPPVSESRGGGRWGRGHHGFSFGGSKSRDDDQIDFKDIEDMEKNLEKLKRGIIDSLIVCIW